MVKKKKSDNSRKERFKKDPQPRDPRTGRFVKRDAETKKESLNTDKEILDVTKQILNALSGTAEAQKKLNEEKEKQKQLDQELNDQLGLTGEGLDKINKLFGGALGSSNDILKNAKENLKATMEKKGIDADQLTTMDKMKAMTGAIGKSIKGNMLDPANLLQMAFDYNKQLTDLRKGLALSYGEAQKLKFELDQAANTMGGMAIHAKDTAAAFGLINDTLGTSATNLTQFDTLLTDTAKLQKLWKMSSESAANFARENIRTGKSVHQIKLDSIGMVVAAEKEHGARLDIRKVLDESGKITGQIRAQLGGSLENIVDAVAHAKQLGLELGQIAQTADALLDFESSIEKELQAELITGRELNLEKARLYALTGDYKGLTEEINAQGMDWNTWLGMNVLQQRDYADALGMTADSLSDALMMEQDLTMLAQEARDAGNEDLARQIEARNAQEKFQDAVMKLKDVFVTLAGPLSVILEALTVILKPIEFAVQGLSKMVNLAGNFLGIFKAGKQDLKWYEAIFGSILGIMGFIYIKSKLQLGLEKLRVAWGQKDLVLKIRSGAVTAFNTVKSWALTAAEGARAIASMAASSAMTVGIGIAAILAAIAIGAIAIKAAIPRKTGDMISGPQGGSGYGKRTLVAPEGTYALNNNDTVIAGTKLFRADDVFSTGKGNLNMGIDYGKLATAMSKVQVNTSMHYDSFRANNKNGLQHKGNITSKNKIV